MAHVKVVRRSMRPEEWTDLRFTWLQRGIWADEEEITGLRVRDAHQISENAYEFVDGEERPLNRGDMMFTPDGTAFIRGTANIPERFAGQRVYLRLHTAAEMIVRVNGKLVGGIDPNRDAILLTPYIDRPELTIEIEAYNRSKPDDERNPASLSTRGCRQIFEGAFLCTRRDNVQSLVYDYILFMDMAHSEYFNEDLRRYLFKELSKALDFVDFDTFEGVDEAARYVEEKIYQNTDFKGSGDVALVAHSHLDIAYYWRRIHAVQKNARTILIQLRLMDRYPEFRYTHTQAYTYETLEKYYPELFKELSVRVAEGRFEPVGAMYVEPDCNIPAAESLIRQFLYGQHFFRRAFGKTVDNAWLPDVFGNSWILPQILRKCGVSYFVSNKMSTWNDTNRFPHNNFIWKGIDGTTVYACVPPTHFITWNMPSQVQENWEAYQDKETGGQTLQMYGYGDGGSGATEEMVELARRFPRVSAMPKVELTGGSEFLHRNFDGNQELATWDGELYLEMHRGTFTTKSNLKQLNRQMEFMLRNAELVLALRALSGKAYPGEELTEIYKKVLLNQFHDILPGSHIRPVYEDAMAKSEETAEILARAQSSEGGLFVGTRRKKDRSDSLTRDGLNKGSGAGIFLQKAIYNRWRFAHLKIFTKTAETYLIFSVGVSLLVRFVAESNTLVPTALTLAALAFFRTLGNPLTQDTQMSYFTLIPETTGKKLFFSLMGGSYNCLMDVIIGLIPAVLILNASPLDALLWAVVIVSIDFYATVTATFIDLSVPVHTGKTIKQFIQILFIYFGLIPDVVVIALSLALLQMPVMAAAGTILINLFFGGLFFFLSVMAIDHAFGK